MRATVMHAAGEQSPIEGVLKIRSIPTATNQRPSGKNRPKAVIRRLEMPSGLRSFTMRVTRAFDQDSATSRSVFGVYIVGRNGFVQGLSNSSLMQWKPNDSRRSDPRSGAHATAASRSTGKRDGGGPRHPRTHERHARS
jgi:hypothetical protein